MGRRVWRRMVCVLGLVAAAGVAVWSFVAQPTCRASCASAATADPVRLREHVEALSQRFHPRDWRHAQNLDACADYIAAQFRRAGAAVEFQVFAADGKQYRNVIGRFAAERGPRVVVGAHYDAHTGTPGADDNASGVAALIELAGLLGRHAPTGDVELVAYSVEEPPFFRQAAMGSAVHAASIAGHPPSVKGVIVLESVGYYSDAARSQSYPTPLLRLAYPSRGNFVVVASRGDQGDWIRTVKARMKGATRLPVYSIRAPSGLPGIDFSDHRSYWPYGIPALMVTDTAFYRNRAYHTADDTAERLDYVRLGQVAVAVFEAVRGV